jgi:putative transposase
MQANHLQDWLVKIDTKPLYIAPGSPWEQGYNDRFNGTLRREVLNADWFASVKQARTVIGKWLKQYNTVRPHQAFIMRPPVPETLQTNAT